MFLLGLAAGILLGWLSFIGLLMIFGATTHENGYAQKPQKRAWFE